MGIDNIILKMFLTTGINVDCILPLRTPKLRRILEDIITYGLAAVKKKVGAPQNLEKERKGDKELEDWISSSIIIVTEVTFGE